MTKPTHVNSFSINGQPAFTILMSDGTVWHKNYRTDWYQVIPPKVESSEFFEPIIQISHEATTNRGKEWEIFSKQVLHHVDTYAAGQYGDAPNDKIESESVEDCMKQINKYVQRFGRNQREGQDLLDLMKISHYACIAHAKLQKGK